MLCVPLVSCLSLRMLGFEEIQSNLSFLVLYTREMRKWIDRKRTSHRTKQTSEESLVEPPSQFHSSSSNACEAEKKGIWSLKEWNQQIPSWKSIASLEPKNKSALLLRFFSLKLKDFFFAINMNSCWTQEPMGTLLRNSAWYKRIFLICLKRTS